MSTRQSRRGAVTLTGQSRQPLYKEVKLAITRMLSSGEMQAGEAIPTEKQLCEIFGTSIGTIRRAIDELVAEHVLIRQQGRGTFLAPYSPDRMLNIFFNIVSKDGRREVPIVQTLSFQNDISDAETAKELAIRDGDEIYKIHNIMLMGGEPAVLDEIRISSVLFPGLTETEFVSRDMTIYDLYQNRFGINVIRTSDRLRSIPADVSTAKRLNIPLGMPLLEILRVAVTFEDRPVEWRRTLLNTENFEYRNLLKSDGL
ncbi:GntR family transcriptional regulator [Hwanghaeella sp. 1Z406]|uniref:GntR family transcriptional regulator n=1 Tax=Hwanghaeella sp. 1Z406 TaxID=3402811 RepID=UPI003B672FC8